MHCTVVTSRREALGAFCATCAHTTKTAKIVSLSQLPGGCTPWTTACNCIHLAPSQLWGIGTWTLWVWISICLNQCKTFHPSKLASVQDPPPIRRALLIPTGALGSSKTIVGSWNANLKPLCTKMLCEEVFPFQDITDFFNNPSKQVFPLPSSSLGSWMFWESEQEQ